MRINGLTACVNYSDTLAAALPRWMDRLASLTVVTDMADNDTVDLVMSHPGVRIHRTNQFYKNGAHFNKSGSMEEAREEMPWEDWILFFDADIIPPVDWYDKVVQFDPAPDSLYGCMRRQCGSLHGINDPNLPYIKQIIGLGYFQLFHSSDPLTIRRPLLKSYTNAAGYDNEFMDLWRKNGRRVRELPISVVHVGEIAQNWCGKGNETAMRRLVSERRRHRSWRHEEITSG